MANGYHHKTFTALDIEKYHKGQLSPAEMHALEKAALDDPFLADALEGYTTAGVNVAADMAELQKRLQERTDRSRVVPLGKNGGGRFPVLRVAAMVAVLIVAGFLITRLAFNKKEDGIAHVDKTTVPADAGQKDTIRKEVVNAYSDTNNSAATPTTGTPENSKTGTTGDIVKADAPAGKTNARDIEPPTQVPVQEKRTDSGDVHDMRDIAVTSSAERKEPLAREKQLQSGKDQNETKAKAAAANGSEVAAAKKTESQQRAQAMNTFRGRVTDEANNGVPFANVTNIQDNAGTYTDASGYFNFRSPDTVLDVQVRSIGFENNISRLNRSAPTNHVVLEEDRSLNEMVISNSRPNTEARSRRSNVTLEEPEPADGWTNYDAYLANNLNVPDDYRTKPEPNPAVEVSFEVDSNGEPVDIRVERSLCKKCDSEAIRLIKEGPKWKRTANSRGRTRVTINF